MSHEVLARSAQRIMAQSVEIVTVLKHLQRPAATMTWRNKLFQDFFIGKAQLATRLENITPRLRKRKKKYQTLKISMPDFPLHMGKSLCPTIARVVRSWRLYSRNTDFLCLCWWCVVSFGRPVPRNYYAHALKAKATKGDRRRRHKVSLIIKFRPRYLLLCRKHKNIFMLPRLVFSAFFLKPISEISIFGLKVNLCASAGRVQAFRGSAVLA